MMLTTAGKVFFCALMIIHIFKPSQQLCQAPWKITMEGDYIIVALFPIHLYDSATSRYKINLQAAVWAEAFLFAIEEINSKRTVLGSKKLGYIVYDTCNTISIAQRSILETILDYRTSDSNGNKTSYPLPSTYKCTCIANKTANIVSVVGGASSKISSSVSTLLGVDLIPQISYSSTSIDLSNKLKYPNFLRTIPPDNFQAEFIVDILDNYGWEYINVLASDDSYGRVGVDYLLPLLAEKGICVAVLNVFSTRLSQEEFEQAVRGLRDKKAANVTVLWSGKTAARSIIDAAVRIQLHERTWIATEGWSGDEEILKKDPRVVKGLIGGIPLMKLYQPFEGHLVGKSSEDLQVYRAIYNTTNCRYTNYSQETYPELHTFKNFSSTLRVKIPNVIDAVYAVAHGLRALQSQAISHPNLLEAIKHQTFIGSTGISVRFNTDGDPSTAAYSLVNTKLSQNDLLEFQILGLWDSESHKIRLSSEVEVQFAGNGTTVPLSRCADECGPGFYAFMETNKRCCWKCLQCPQDTFKNKSGNEKCTPCTRTSVSYQNGTGCTELREVHLKIDSTHGIIVATMSGFGAIMSLAGVIIFLLFRNTPLVRSSNRELSILQLTISTLTFLYPLLYMIKPNIIICYAKPLVFGVLFSISNSIIFTKADRLLRIFKIRYRIRRRSVTLMLSNKFQILVVIATAGLAIVLCLMSFTFNPPMLVHKIDRGELSIDAQCTNITIATNLLVAYMGLISITCIVYIIKSKNLPRQFREGRYIGLGMFIASLAWLFYLPISYSGQDKQMTDFTFCSVVCISNATLLSVIYFSKAWRILMHPEENNIHTFRGQLEAITVPANQFSRNFSVTEDGQRRNTENELR